MSRSPQEQRVHFLSGNDSPTGALCARLALEERETARKSAEVLNLTADRTLEEVLQ